VTTPWGLADALADNPMHNPKVWKAILARCDENEKSDIINKMSEEMRKIFV